MTKSGVCLPSAHLLVTFGPLAHLISESGDYVKQQALSRCNHAALSHIYSRCGSKVTELCERVRSPPAGGYLPRGVENQVQTRPGLSGVSQGGRVRFSFVYKWLLHQNTAFLI